MISASTRLLSFSRVLLSKTPATLQAVCLLRPTTFLLTFRRTCFTVEMEKKTFERLPAHVVPINYNLTLQPDLSNFTFTGKECVHLEVKTATDKIILNSVEIKISTASVKSQDKDLTTSEIVYNTEEETVTLVFASELPVGPAHLYMDYEGILNDKMKGFYRSKYTSADGEERYCAVTQFEPTDARRALPCWDEPAVKATFDITLIVPKDRVALSNMNIVESSESSEDNSLKVVKFACSPIMSTYLLAFVVGEFDHIEDKDSDGVLVRVYTPVGKTKQGQFALEVAVKTLPFYNQYFGIAYPLPKIDLIAIPDFAAGAMENWGLVTYRETALLVDPEQSSAANKQWVALVVGHELAHQWFGNLVTMEWWTHLWLNEGFASWIEYLCVDECFPKYDIWKQFIINDFTRALELDALKNSHPIEVPVGHPSEIDEIFDTISYSKGASVIRMLHDYIGKEDFKKGLNHYLTKFAYKNGATEDLWDSLSFASGKPVADVMSTWTEQMGFPVLAVSAKQEGDDRVLSISQSKFNADGPVKDNVARWMVPVSVSGSGKPGQAEARTLLDKPQCTLNVPNIKPEQWVKLNPGQVGFYRVRYTTEMLDLLLPGISDQSLPDTDRLGLQNDLFALARAGFTSTTDVLKVMEAFKNETHYTVWNDLATSMNILSVLLEKNSCHDNFKKFCLALLGPVATRMGWEQKKDEGHLDALLRSMVHRCRGHFGDTETINEAKKRFETHHTGTQELAADLRSAVYSTVLQHGDETTLDTVLNLFRKADLQEEKVRLMRCMGSVSQPELIKKVLDFSMSAEVRSQDTVFVIGGVTGSALGREMAWQFTKDNWKELHDRFEGGFLLSRLVKNTTESFASEEKAKDVENFFSEHPAPAAERTIQQSLENIRLNAGWLKRDAEAIKSWLTSNGY